MFPLRRLGDVRRDHVVARVLHQQRVAIRLGALHEGGGDGAVAAALVVHHHGLANHRAKRLRRHAARQIGGAARCRRHNEGDGARRVAALRECRCQRCGAQHRQCGGGQCVASDMVHALSPFVMKNGV
ncbi:hypothetical protein SDC9_142975 [bioreactor metagenome]|uniref:Uncharacterized protein n=1 Tax=bioreactor metagenome TaxID=1076179 RepID=A0A645E229_9ZZZZ